MLALVKPSANNKTYAIIWLLGLVMATGLNRLLRLSGNLLLPPYCLVAGFMVTNIAVSLLTDMF